MMAEWSTIIYVLVVPFFIGFPFFLPLMLFGKKREGVFLWLAHKHTSGSWWHTGAMAISTILFAALFVGIAKQLSTHINLIIWYWLYFHASFMAVDQSKIATAQQEKCIPKRC